MIILAKGNIKIVDMHTHTLNSPDGNHTAEYMASAAEKNGIYALAFTDHCEVDYFYKEDYDKYSEKSFTDISKVKKDFEGRLNVLCGVELGQPHYDKELAEKIINMHNYDIVIGSIHNLRNMEDFCYWDYGKTDIEAALNEYYDENINMASFGKVDTIAHITYPFRYIFNSLGYVEDIKKYKKKTDELFKICAEKDIALEINMGGLNYPIKMSSPDFDTVKRFKELGGKLITVGSDSHYAERIGKGIDKAYEIAREAGFKSVAIFKNRKPEEFPIV